MRVASHVTPLCAVAMETGIILACCSLVAWCGTLNFMTYLSQKNYKNHQSEEGFAWQISVQTITHWLFILTDVGL